MSRLIFRASQTDGILYWKSQEKFREMMEKEEKTGQTILDNLFQLEKNCVEDIAEMLTNFDEQCAMKVVMIFSHIAAMEMNFYK